MSLTFVANLKLCGEGITLNEVLCGEGLFLNVLGFSRLRVKGLGSTSSFCILKSVIHYIKNILNLQTSTHCKATVHAALALQLSRKFPATNQSWNRRDKLPCRLLLPN